MQLGPATRRYAPLVANLLADKDSVVRLHTVIALGEMKAAEFRDEVFKQSYTSQGRADRIMVRATAMALANMDCAETIGCCQSFGALIHSDDPKNERASNLDRQCAIDVLHKWSLFLNCSLATTESLLLISALRVSGRAETAAMDPESLSDDATCAHTSFWLVRMTEPYIPWWLREKVLMLVRDDSNRSVARFAWPEINQALSSTKKTVRCDAIRCIAALGRHAGWLSPVVAMALADPSTDVRCAALEALPCLGRASATYCRDSFETLLAHRDCGVRRSVILAIQRLGSSQHTESLRRLLQDDPDEHVRRLAAQA
jgi:hypothetical protein